MARSGEPLPFFRNVKGWSKDNVVRSEKTAIGWIFKLLQGQTTLGPSERKMGILPPRSVMQVQTDGVYPQDPRIFQTDLGSLDLSYREIVMEQTFGCWFASLFESRALPYGVSLRGICDLKMTSKKALSSSVRLSAHRILGKLSSFVEGKLSTKSVFSGICLAGPASLLKREASKLAQRS